MVLLFTFNSFQGSAYFSTANTVIGHMMKAKSTVIAYFHLTEANEALAMQNSQLLQQVSELKLQLVRWEENEGAAYTKQPEGRDDYDVYTSLVVDNSISLADNYITIDKGLADGITPDMGVVGSDGVIGVTYKCTQHFSLVLPILNGKSSISCKVAGSNYFGYLNWEGGDIRYATLYDLPRYSEVQMGDTIVTSGYSTSFPEGIMVGRVEGLTPSADGLYITLKVALSTDFANLRHSFVISRRNVEELAVLNADKTDER